VAIYYSVLGLASIFAAAVIPIVVMGTILEVSKLVAAWWLKVNWHRAPFFLKSYMLVAVLVLMLITSMGIFGFLSRAHSDQAIPTGDIASQVAIFDEKIKTQRDNIEAARKALAQMDAQVDARLARSEDDRGAERAVQIRRQQARERTVLQNEIAKAQAEIAVINEQKAPIASQLRTIEAEVGPIKYIAKLIYGDNPDANILEKAVTWVIIIIVFVFDPLAVLLLLSSQLSFQWYRQEKEKPVVEESSEQDVEEFFQRGKLVARGLDADEEARLAEEANALIAEIERETPEVTLPEEKPVEPEKSILEQHPYLNKGFSHFENLQPMVSKPEVVESLTVEEIEEDDTDLSPTEKRAVTRWKAEHPDSSIKLQRKLLEKGAIKQLPWIAYIEEPVEDDAAAEALKWAQEQIDESKKKTVTWLEKDGKEQIKRIREQ
jgi:hypothetical protein